jgi:hypothetical protein
MVGNGTSNSQRKNAMTLYKNGVLALNNLSALPLNYEHAFYILNDKPFYGDLPLTGQLEKLTENGNTGWRLANRNVSHYGFIGEEAFDFSYSTGNSSIRGATGNNSVAFGVNTTAEAINSLASGYLSKALGQLSHVFGDNLVSKAYSGFVTGVFNDSLLTSNQTNITENTPLFMVGNGNSPSSRSNALVVLKNGRIFMGQNSNSARLSLTGGNWDVNNTDGDMMIGNNTVKLKFSMATSGAGTGVSRINSTGNAANQSLLLGVNGNDHVQIFNNGFVGLGVSPAHPIHHNNGARLTTAGVWTNASDKRLKTDIATLTYGINEVMQLKPSKYTMMGDGSIQIGFIAQDLKKVIPEVVNGFEGDVMRGETLAVAYGNMTALLTKAIQEQQMMIVEQDNKIKHLESKCQNLNVELETLYEKFETLNFRLSSMENTATENQIKVSNHEKK